MLMDSFKTLYEDNLCFENTFSLPMAAGCWDCNETLLNSSESHCPMPSPRPWAGADHSDSTLEKVLYKPYSASVSIFLSFLTELVKSQFAKDVFSHLLWSSFTTKPYIIHGNSDWQRLQWQPLWTSWWRSSFDGNNTHTDNFLSS